MTSVINDDQSDDNDDVAEPEDPAAARPCSCCGNAASNCDKVDCAFNVVEPHKRPRVTLTPSLAMKDGKPFLCFGVQGGDTQDQNLLQFFLNMVEFGMTVQESTEESASSSKRISGLRRMARAMLTLCFCPPDNVTPRSPSMVS